MTRSPWDLGELPTPAIPLTDTFEGFLGLDWLELTRESARVRFDVRQNLKQPMGLLHGGVYSAVAETVASVATAAAVWRDGLAASGLSNSASFLRPVTQGHGRRRRPAAPPGRARVAVGPRVPRRAGAAVRARRRDDRGASAAVVTAVDLDGRALELLDLPGPAPALVLLHEGLGSVGLWRTFPERLHAETGRRLLAFSRFGHGRSVPPPRRRTPAFFHDEALEVLPALLDRLGIERPVLVGHSDGGSIALIYAADHPVTALALLAPHVFVEEVTVREIAQTREQYLNGGLRERMARHHDDPDAAFWGWCDVWLDPEFRAWNLEREAARVDAPTLLIQGADDPYGSLEQIDRIEAQVRGPVQRLVLEGGHSPHLEHEREVVEALARFLSPAR